MPYACIVFNIIWVRCTDKWQWHTGSWMEYHNNISCDHQKHVPRVTRHFTMKCDKGGTTHPYQIMRNPRLAMTGGLPLTNNTLWAGTWTVVSVALRLWAHDSRCFLSEFSRFSRPKRISFQKIRYIRSHPLCENWCGRLSSRGHGKRAREFEMSLSVLYC